MTNLWGGEARRRLKREDSAALAAVAVAHLCLFAIVAEARRPPVLSDSSGDHLGSGVSISLSRLDRPAPPRPPAPPKPPAPEPVPAPKTVSTTPVQIAPALELKLATVVATDQVQPLLVTALPASPTAPAPPQAATAAAADSTQGGGAKRCDILAALQSFLQTDPGARTAIAFIPAKARSVANAVMIWDGGWADPPAIGGPQALDPIQTGVLQTVLSAPPVCQSEIVRGPRLIVVGDEHDSTVLAFGSGEWRWGDLAEDKARPQSVQTINR